MDIDFLKKKLKEVKPPLKGKMVEKKAAVSITLQCDLLSISRALFYYRPAGLTDLDLKLMGKMDELPDGGNTSPEQGFEEAFWPCSGTRQSEASDGRDGHCRHLP